jgi:hypothetical protein
MNESSDRDDAQMEHPDLDEAEKVDEHGPAFVTTLEGLDDVAEDQGMAGLDRWGDPDA